VELLVFEHSAGETQSIRGLRPKDGTEPSQRHCRKPMCRPWKSGGRALGAAPSSILRSGLDTCFFCRFYPLLLRVTGRGISREPHWIAPERNEQRQASADISVAPRLGGERRRCRGIASLRRKELVRGCDLLWAPPLPLVDRSADHAQRRRAADGHLRARSRRFRSSGREGERLGSRHFAGPGSLPPAARRFSPDAAAVGGALATWRPSIVASPPCAHSAERPDALQQRRDRLAEQPKRA
jgi:hypothetical protein